MSATVVTPQNLAELATTGRVTPALEMPPTTRERIALKRAGKEMPSTEVKPAPKVEPVKEEPAAKSEVVKPDDSKKVDDKPKPAVKDTHAEPSASKPKTELSEDDLPERARKVIGSKHRQMKEAEEFAELQRKLRLDAEKRVKELEADLAKAKPAEKTEPAGRKAAEDAEPKPEDFANVADYAKAFARWDRQQADRERAQQEAEQAASKHQKKAAETWQERLDAYRETYPEFDDLVGSSPLAKQELPNRVIAAIQESELGPQLLRHLAETPADWAALRELNADKAIKFLGRLEAKLETPPAKDPEPEPKAEVKTDPPPKEVKPDPVKNVSKAPPPTDTTVGTGEPFKKDERDMTTEEFLAHRRAQRKARSGR